MKNWYIKLSTTYKATLVSFVAVVVVYLCLIFGYFTGHADIPNGLILGGGVGVVSYLALALVEKHDKENETFVLTIIVTVLRYLLLAAALVLSALAQFTWGYKIFNLFTLMGGYLIPLITYLVFTLVERKNV